MRKRARGAAEVPPSPTPKPPAQVEPPIQPAKLCLHCKTELAVVVLAGITNIHRAYFCSICCAAEWAIKYQQESGRFWCEKHSRWSANDGNCRDCFLEAVADKTGSCIRTIPEADQGEGVQHG